MRRLGSILEAFMNEITLGVPAVSVNKCYILGRLGADPLLNKTTGGSESCKFSVATSDTWKDKQSGDKKENTQWHSIVAWGSLAELAAKFLRKGSQCFVEGKLQTRSWDDKKTGEKRYVTEIVASSIQFLDAKPRDENHLPPEEKAVSKTIESNAPWGGIEFGSNAKRPDYDQDSIPF